MAKVPLLDVGSLGNPSSARQNINENSGRIENAFDNFLSRDGTSPNQMEADFDAGGYKLLNVADPSNDNDAVNLRSVRPLVDQFAADIIMQAVFGEIVNDTFTATAGQTVVTLSANPGNILNTETTVDGLMRRPTLDYTLSGSELRTLTFVTPLTLGQKVQVRYARALPAGTQAASSVTYVIPSTGSAGTVKDYLDAVNGPNGSSVVGFTQTGAGATVRSVQDKLLDTVSVFDFMSAAQIADVKAGTALIDVTAAIQAAVTAHKRVHAPAGKYLLSGTVAIPIGAELYGAGEKATTFVKNNAALSFFTLGADGFIGNMGFDRVGATVATSGRLIDAAGASGARISNIRASHCWDGIYIANVAGLFMDKIYVNGWQNAGVNIDGTTNDVFLDQFLLTHGGASVGTGIRMWNKAEAITVTNGDIIGGQYSMKFDASSFTPGSSTIPAYSKFTNIYFDSAVFGVVIDKSADIRFTSCWFSNRPNHGAQVLQCYDVVFVNCDFENCGSSGVLLQNTSQKGTKFIGCGFISNNSQNNGSNGLSVDAGVGGFSVIGCSANNDTLGNSQGYGVFIASGASDNYHIIGNNLVGNAIGAVSDGGTGTNKKVTGNLGYEPAFIAPTLGNSWTNLGGAYAVAGYSKDADGYVTLRGTIASGTIPSSPFTLPAGFRPTLIHAFPAVTSTGYGRVDVANTGVVTVQSGGNGSVSLESIRFKAG